MAFVNECVWCSYTLIHNNADKLLSSCQDPLTPRPLNQETNKVKMLVLKVSSQEAASVVTEEEVASAVATEAVSVEETEVVSVVETEVDVSFTIYLNLYSPWRKQRWIR